MKTILFTFIFTISSLLYTLDAQVQVVKDSLSISKMVGYQQKVDFNGCQVKFKKVIADSRCPKNVMCVRAGEAQVLLSIYKEGVFIEDKKIRIDASGYVMESTNLAFDTKDFKIYGFSLTPYPDGVGDIDHKAYQLEVVFKTKRLE